MDDAFELISRNMDSDEKSTDESEDEGDADWTALDADDTEESSSAEQEPREGDD